MDFLTSLRRLARVVAPLSAGALLACNDAATTPPAPAGASLAVLQHSVDSSIATLHIPGAVALVRVAGGSEYVIASGVDNTVLHTAMSASDRFRVGSIAKTMVSTIVLQLVDENTLSVSDTLARWFPGIVANANRITVRQLLNHTSGIPNYTDDPTFDDAITANPGRAWSPMDLVAIANLHAPSFAPGASGRWEYSNTNYILLGLIIEQVTGSPLGDELQRRILDPLHLTSTFMATSVATPAPFSRGYLDVGGDHGIDVASILNPTSAGAAGALVSTAHDLATFAESLASGALLTPATQQLRLALVRSSGSEQYAMGLQYTGSWLGHAGQFPGYEATMFTRPGVGTIVVLTNKSTDSGIAAYSIYSELRWLEFGYK